MITKKMMCMALMMFGLCAGAMAQKNIDKVVADMEKKSDTRITSIKKRDPDSRKVVKVTKTLRLTDAQIAKRALEAFEKDEEDALTSIKEKRNRVEYTLTYRNKTDKRTYILTIREGNDVEIYVSITPANEKDTSWMGKDGIKYDIDMAKYERDMEKYKKDMAQYEIDMSGMKKLDELSDDVRERLEENLKKNEIELNGSEIYVNERPLTVRNKK
ncbi:DUF5024 domain-containing protein [Phocaeicola sp.]